MKKRNLRFGHKLRSLLADRLISQTEFGRALHRSQSRVSKWVSGDGNPTPAELFMMAQVLGCTVRYLCDDDLDDLDMATMPDYVQTHGAKTDEQIVLGILRTKGSRWVLDRLIENHGDVAGAPGARSEKTASYRAAVTKPSVIPAPAQTPKAPKGSKTEDDKKTRPPKKDPSGRH